MRREARHRLGAAEPAAPESRAARRVLIGAAVTASTVAERLRDDPVAFWRQAARLLPERALRPAARTLAGAPWPAVAATAAHVLGRDDRAEKSLVTAAAGRLDARATRRLADVALSMGRAADAERLLALVPEGTRGRAGTQARQDWCAGRMTDAVAGLRRAVSAGGATAAERRRLDRYEDELRLFTDWRPTLTRVVGYRPDPASVLHVLTDPAPDTRSGCPERTRSLLAATAARGWTVTAATGPGRSPLAGRSGAAAAEVVDGVAYHRILPARPVAAATGRLQQQAQSLLDLALRTRPAVLHTTTSFVNALVTESVARALGIPWVYEVRGEPAGVWTPSGPSGPAPAERCRLFAAREAEALASADDVVTPGPALADRVRTLVPARPDGPLRVRVVPDAVGGAYLEDPLPQGEARRTVGLPEGARILGTVASVVADAGLDDLLRAAAQLVDEVPDLLVVVVGDGPARPGLEELAAELGLPDRVRFPGRVPGHEAALYHQAFDVFVVPCKDSAAGRAVAPLEPVEAMATATPVVASCLPALAEVVTDGVTGMLSPAEDPRTLATVLKMLLQSPVVRRCLGEEGRRRALSARTWDAVASSTVESYCRLTGSAALQEASA